MELKLILVNNPPKTKNVIFKFNRNRRAPIKNEFEAARFFSALLRKETPLSLKLPWASVIINEGMISGSIVNMLQKNSGKIYYLHKDGCRIVETSHFPFKGNETFLLGDSEGVPKDIEKLLDKKSVEKISLGPLEYLTSHCVMLLLSLYVR